ncbi:MAG: hypothetical protein AB7Q45_19180, partial [Planctomycetaceae bacterium]
MKKTISRLQEFSIPLILGVAAALAAANVDAERYHRLVQTPQQHHRADQARVHAETAHTETAQGAASPGES